MTAPRLWIATLLLLAAADAKPIEGKARLVVELDRAAWVNEGVVLYLDLMTTGLSFSTAGGPRYVMPEVPGGLLVDLNQPGVSLTEQDGNRQWLVIRYRWLFMPRRPGRLVIPPIEANVVANSGYGSMDETFRVRTQSTTIEAAMPPGIPANQPFVVSSDFRLTAGWSPEPGEARAGDAFTLTVEREADQFPAMGFEPLSLTAPEGVAVYPAAAEVKDASDRGRFRGRRTDRFSIVLESQGRFALPSMDLWWFNPVDERAQVMVVPGAEFNAAAPAARGQPDTEKPGFLRPLVWASIILALAGGSAWVTRRRWVAALAEARQRRAASEAARWKEFLATCKAASAQDCYGALQQWLRTRGVDETTLNWARSTQDLGLEREVLALQLAINEDESSWRGEALRVAVARHRASVGPATGGETGLPPLNPAR